MSNSPLLSPNIATQRPGHVNRLRALNMPVQSHPFWTLDTWKCMIGILHAKLELFMPSGSTDSKASMDAPSQTERVVVNLREKLLRGDFRPGERLAELTLAPMLNASRTPVRLALERLSHEGLLEARPRGGFSVRQFTLADVWDSIEVRGVLEGTAARLAAERLTSSAELDTLRRRHEAFETIAGPMDMEGFVHYVEHNLAYHHELWKLAKSPTLLRTLEQLSAMPFAGPSALVFGAMEDAQEFHARISLISIEHHRVILEAIENHEGARAESVAREHARMARKNLDWALRNPERLQEFPGGTLIALPGAAGNR